MPNPAKRRLHHDSARVLVERLWPGARLTRTERLRGGLGSYMHALSIETAAAQRFRVVLRRYSLHSKYGKPRRA
jgi:hypothetical protein